MKNKGTHSYTKDNRNKTIQIYINGDFYYRDNAKISVFDSGFLLGDGVWEGIRLHNGQLCFLDEHLQRLYWGAKQINIDIPYTSIIKNITHAGKTWLITFKLPRKYIKYIVKKGSVTINGVSLTISNIFRDCFQIAVIPQTLKLTNLIFLKKKDRVNVEFDVLGKYISKFFKRGI